ncbi:MAG: putative acetyltransferase [Saprospiraceae bacterium]|jgi:putative acetyltransferase
MQVIQMSPLGNDVRALVGQLDSYMEAMYPAESNHFDPVETLAQPGVLFAGVYDGDSLCAIGAVKAMHNDGDYGEIKRVFVSPDQRGKGLAKLMMQFLESHLLESGISCVRLETGVYQPEAVTLYEKLGYKTRHKFGCYGSDPLSVFMEKKLTI